MTVSDMETKRPSVLATSMIIFLLAITFSDVEATKCLRCDAVIQPRHCHVITDCNQGEECYVDQYEGERGETLYNTGCRSSALCLRKRSLLPATLNLDRDQRAQRGSPVTCSECCTGDMCNSQGCGEPGYPLSRGPICYDCKQTMDPVMCATIYICNTNEFCSIEKISEFGDIFYNTGCATRGVCDLKNTVKPPFGKRELRTDRAVRCNHCCTGDFCNENCGNGSTVAPPSTQSGHTAYEYILMFLTNYNTNPNNIEIIITSKVNTDVSMVTMNSTLTTFPMNFTMTTNSSHQNFAGSVTSTPGVLQSNGIAVKLSEKGSVYGVSYLSASGSADGYSALPVNKLGREYRAISYPVKYFNSDNDRSIFGIVSTKPKTNVNITFQTTVDVNGKTYSAGDVISQRFDDPLQTYSLKSEYDLTGTLIQSSEPVGVVSGNTCNPLGDGGCNHMIEYLPATKDWGRYFVVPHMNASSTTDIVIVSKTSSAVVNITSTTGSVDTYNVNGRARINNLYKDRAYYISSDEPILVAMFSYDTSGKAFMSLVPSTDQYSNDYVITDPTHSTFADFVAIIIESKYSGQLLINDIALSATPKTLTTRDNITWHVFTLDLHNDVITIRHPSASVRFGVIQYGFKYGQAYGYPTGLNL